MKKCLVFIFIISLLGCVSFPEKYDYGYNPVKIQDSKKQSALTNIEHVYIGMSKSEINNVLGDGVDIGYKADDNNVEGVEKIIINNPYKIERLASGDRKYEVQYYFTEVNQPDGKITDDELVPLIFEGDKLIGKGSKYLATLKKNIN